MRIFNETKTQELFDIDKNEGVLKEDTLEIFHEAIPAIEGKFHFEVIAEYPNGGKDIKKVWDVEPVDGKDAWIEYENILVYVPYTEEELLMLAQKNKKKEIEENIQYYKDLLESWDYKNSKYLDGEYTDIEWQKISIQRKEWRDEINRLEYELEQLRGVL